MVAPAQNFQPGQPMMGGDQDADSAAGSVRIYIDVAADGSLEVGQGPVPPEDEAAGGAESADQPAKDIADALKQALMLYKQISGSAKDQGQAAFNSGFGAAGASPSSSAQVERMA